MRDHLLIFLAVFSSGTPLPKLAALTHIPRSTVETMIKRIRPFLQEMLEERWLKDPDIGAILDATPWEIKHPAEKFVDAAAFYSAHYSIYCVKMQVTVTTKHPVLAVHLSNAFPGSKHDMAMLPSTRLALKKYLSKRPDEEVSGDYWKVLADSGYVGPQPGPFELVPLPKHSTHSFDEQETELVKARVRVENFFGRRTMFWPITGGKYPFGRKTVYADLTIAMLLTNEVSGSSEKEDEDYAKAYRNYLDGLGSSVEAQRKKWRTQKGRKRKISDETQTTDAQGSNE